jgi:hypothetical protein
MNYLPWQMVWTLAGVIGLCANLTSVAEEYPITPEEQAHWAWQKPVRPAIPAVKDASWVRNPIDAFILARLEQEGLRPAPRATREQLARRLALDLNGLPLSLEQLDSFLGDESPDAYDRLMNQLLASPAYGERWGRHWLDVARFAESNGYEHDEDRPDAWRFRDYVIRAFNADKPYDRFVREQLAGDELFPDDPDALIATGFNLLGPDMTDSSDQKQRRQNTLNDMTNTAGLAFLGLTMGCARCHDHKFEPIPQEDYYRLQAFFTPARFRTDLPLASKARQAEHAHQLAELARLTRPYRDKIASLLAPYRDKLRQAKLAKLGEAARQAHQTPREKRTPAQKDLVSKTQRFLAIRAQELTRALTLSDRREKARLERQIKDLERRHAPAPLPVALGLDDPAGVAPPTFVLHKGDLYRPEQEVKPGVPIILTPDHHPRPLTSVSSSGRTGRAALASWLASRENPLTARVIVNRVWQHHFGTGLVATTSDFGLRGARPTHPGLLDWLAVEFMEQGWSVKTLHRLILTSATYQQSCRGEKETHQRDPENHWLGRMNRIRLEGEVLRDSLLDLGGRLQRKMGGPGVFPPIPPEVIKGAKGWRISPDPDDHVRRSVYIFVRRNLRYPFLEVFDQPDTNLSCSARETSTTAPQALTLLNAEEVIATTRACARRVQQQAVTREEQISRCYRLVLGRSPSASEQRLAREFLDDSPLSELVRALCNLNEFVYRE